MKDTYKYKKSLLHSYTQTQQVKGLQKYNVHVGEDQKNHNYDSKEPGACSRFSATYCYDERLLNKSFCDISLKVGVVSLIKPY